MIARPEEFSRISLATADDELAEIVRNEYGEIPDENQRFVELRNGRRAYVFIDLREDDIAEVLGNYDGSARYALFQLNHDGKDVSPDKIANMEDFLSDCLVDEI